MFVYEIKDTDEMRCVLNRNYLNTLRYHNLSTLRAEIKNLLDDPDGAKLNKQALFKE